ncbi:Tripartite-type tricarboxylate transporter, receptor component TctC [Polaromonas sp. OV174]|uniref:Bug family tripartite tricarboxylate transporter substrate binding protein n=1 Tax=Polaromonas sp. OV174 TaxID=1855300 RepID=UPI0008EAC5BE|nr:tripartite tricarboxylate transporter substrate binding protein [Polaromonas sp. OV174]SFC72501.1 Tripartite-type tricarboxylate transporter, receptor component TctC [Polaromonas sp. OV174]
MKLSFVKSLTTAFAGAVAIAALTMGSAQAAGTFPSKPVRIIYPFAPGGGMEVMLRVIAQEMQKSTGQSFLIDNRTGAGASIAAQATATAPSDGYTILVAPVGIMAITPHLRKLPYDTQKDLVPIARLSEFRGVLVVSNDLPVKDVAEFIAYAKANPGKISYGTTGIGSQSHVVGEILQRGWGIKLNHVPYKGAAVMVGDLVAGRLDLVNDLTMLQYVKQGKAKLLTVFDDKRFPDFPNTPAVGELPVPQVNKGGTWFGAFAPKGTPPEVIEKIASEFEKALKNPEIAAKMRQSNINPAFLGPKGLKKVWDEDFSLYGKVIKDADIKAE